MAAIAVTQAGTAFTPAAATGGGDTVAGGPGVGGWDTQYLVVIVGATATTVTVDGTAYGPITSQTVLIPVRRYNGSNVNVTYSQVTAVTVGAVRGAAGAYGTFGT
jgi:hypothetical protein